MKKASNIIKKIGIIKRYKSNKGFTLVELLAIIALLSLIMTIVIYSATNIINEARNKSYQTSINNIEAEAIVYATENIGSNLWMNISGEDEQYQCISVQNLIDAGYFKSDVLESKVGKDSSGREINVNGSDYIYLERNSNTKALTKNILLVGERDAYRHLCNSFSTKGRITFVVEPSGWSKEKEVTITYNLFNVKDTISNYKYNYKYNDIIFNNTKFKSTSATEKLRITENGNLIAKILDDTGVLVTEIMGITKIDNNKPDAEIVSENQVKSSQIVTLKMDDNGGSGVKEYYFGKSDPDTNDVEWIDVSSEKDNNISKTTSVDSSGIWYLAVKDILGNTTIVSREFYKTTLLINNASVTPNTIITMEGNQFNLPTPTGVVTGYEFLGWYSSNGYSGNKITAYTPESDATIYGNVSLKEYSIVYSCGTGSGNSSTNQKVKYGEEFTIAANIGCSKNGYTFTGWKDGASNNWAVGKTDTWKYDNGQYGITNRTLTLTAQWKDDVAPIIRVSNTVNNVDYTGDWTNQNIKSVIEFSDSGSGIDPSTLAWGNNGTTWNKLNNTSTTTYTDTWSSEGERPGYYQICDYDNNCSTVSFNVKIDKSAPSKPTYVAFYDDGSGNYTTGTWTNKQVDTTISTTESASGVKYIQYSTDKTNWNTFNFGLSKLSQDGTTWRGTEAWSLYDRDGTYYFRAVDKVGNISEISDAYNIKYDTKAPELPTIITMYDIHGSRIETTKHMTVSGNAYTTSGNDPYINFNNVGNISGVTGAYIGLSSSTSAVTPFQVFYEVSGTSLNETHSTKLSMPSGETKLYIPFSSSSSWVKIRYDFGSTSGITFNVANLAVVASGNQWNNDDIILRVNSTDAGSGIAYWQYSYSPDASSTGSNANTSWVTHSNSASDTYIPSAYSAERSQYTYIRACDYVGYCSNAAKAYIKIDKTVPTKPTITLSDYNTFTYSSTDSASGIAGYYVSSNNTMPTMNSSWVTSTSYDISSAGTYYVWAKDLAGSGNISSGGNISAYTVTYNANGGSVETTSQVSLTGGNITLPTPTRSDYTFNGWYTSASGGTLIGKAGISYIVTKNITLYAQWTKNISPTATIGSCNSLTYSGLSQTLASGAQNATYSNNTGTNAGTYTVTVTANNNYSFSDGTTSKTLSCTIKQKDENISLTSKSETYTGKVINANTASIFGDGTVKYTYYTDSSCSTKTTTSVGATTSGGAPIDVGTYYVKASVDATNNYKSDRTDCIKHSITAKSISVTWGDTASWIYDGNIHAPTVTTPISGVNNESISLSVSGSSSNVGNYTATAKCASVGGGRTNCSNYKLTNTTKNFEITKRYKVYIQYSVNGGTITSQTTENGITYNWTTKNDVIYKDGSLYQPSIDYEGSLTSFGLVNYNNANYIYIKKDGYDAVSSSEWVCLSGCTVAGKTFSQDKVYQAADFCNAKDADCTVVLGVNWSDIQAPVCTLSVNSSGVSISTSSDNVGVVSSGVSTSSTPVYGTNNLELQSGTIYGYVKDAAGNEGSCHIGLVEATKEYGCSRYAKCTTTTYYTRHYKVCTKNGITGAFAYVNKWESGVTSCSVGTEKTCNSSNNEYSYTTSCEILSSGTNCSCSKGTLSGEYCHLYNQSECPSGWWWSEPEISCSTGYNYVTDTDYCYK